MAGIINLLLWEEDVLRHPSPKESRLLETAFLRDRGYNYKLCRCTRLTLLRSCLQHFGSRYEHPEEVNQANGEHHNRVNPRRSKLGIAENGKFKEQPDERQNDNWPFPGSQAKSMRLRQLAPCIDIQDDRRQVNDRWQQRCRAKQVTQRRALAWNEDAQQGKGCQHDLDENAAEQRRGYRRACLLTDLPEHLIAGKALIPCHGPGETRNSNKDDQATREDRKGDQDQEDVTDHRAQHHGDNVCNGRCRGSQCRYVLRSHVERKKERKAHNTTQ